MNKILIHKGDCTIFADCQRFLTFNIKTDLNLTGWTAKFILGWITKEITDISSKSFEIILGAEDTKQLRLGQQYGSIILTDANGNIKTVTNTIPFEVTTAVVENEYQEVDLTIPESSGVDLTLRVGMQGGSGTTNYELLSNLPKINNVELVGNRSLEELGIQPVGEYALTSDIPTLVSQLENDSDFATQVQVMQAIASIPQFKLSVVSELPLTGEKMTLYFVPKEGSDNDIYNEYIWIEENTSYEFLGSTAVDLTDYVKNTDYANTKTGGVILTATRYGLKMGGTGEMYCVIETLDSWQKMNEHAFVSKGTLDNVLTQYYTKSEIDTLIGNIETLLSEV